MFLIFIMKMEVTKLFKWIHLQFLLDQIDHPLTFPPHCVFLDESSNSSWTVGTALTVSLWSTMGGLWRQNSFSRWHCFEKAPSGVNSAFSGCSPWCHSSLCILCIVLPFDIIDRKPLQQGATRQDGRTFQGHSWRAPLHSTSGHFQVGGSCSFSYKERNIIDRRLELPSPEELKMKILVKAKKIHLTATGSVDVEVDNEALALKINLVQWI